MRWFTGSIAMLLTSIWAPLLCAAETPRVDRIVVVFTTHFDIGYTDLVGNIVQKYRTTMMDQALAVVDRNRDLPPDRQFVWTIAGWPMHKILQDWPGQTPERRQRILDAFKTGRFVTQALPFTTHTETLSLEDIVRGMDFSSQLCRSAGLPLPRDAKMTDVPEHTWVLPTILKAAGVEFLHLGCNGGSHPMQVPLLFWWEGPDGSRVLTMYATQYGTQLVPPANWKYHTWLALMHTGDNHGPPRPEEVKKLLDEAARRLPGVKVTIGRLSDFSDAILAEKAEIPVVRGDMPDTWIHGPMCDPEGMAIAQRVRPEMATAERLNTLLRAWDLQRESIAPTIAQAREQSLLYGEHTWGGSIGWIGNKIPFGDDFTRARQAGKFARSELSWEQHTDYIRTAARLIDPVLSREMQTLARGVKVAGPRIVVFNPLPWARDGLVSVAGAGERIAAVRPAEGGEAIPLQALGATDCFVARDVPAMGYRTYVPVTAPSPAPADVSGPVIENGHWKLTIDPVRGAISGLIDKSTGRDLAARDDELALGQHLYERFGRKNINDFIKAYCRSSAGGWVQNDFGKVGLPPDATYQRAVPHFVGSELRHSGGPVESTLSISGQLQMTEGKQCRVVFSATLYRDLPCVDLEMKVLDKPLEPWPEAMWMALPLNVPNPRFLLGRVGSVVDPATQIIPGANRHMATLKTGMLVMAGDGKWGVGLCPLDSPMVSLDEPGCWKFDLDFVPHRPRVFLNIFNNQWSTNFRLYNGGNWTSRVRVWAVDSPALAGGLVVPSLQTRYPLQASFVDAPAGAMPPSGQGLSVSRKGVMVTALGDNPDGAGRVLRLWELAGESGPVTVSLPEQLDGSLQEVDLRGRPLGDPVAPAGSRFTVEMRSFGVRSFRIGG